MHGQQNIKKVISVFRMILTLSCLSVEACNINHLVFVMGTVLCDVRIQV